MDYSYLQKAADECHGDEDLIECFGDCDIWCTCMEEIEQAKERMTELHFDSLRNDDGEDRI